MNGEELDRRLDEWLDRAAAEYGRTDARPGFEARIIADLNSRLEKRKWHFRWIPIAAAAAILILSILVLRTGFQDRPRTEIVQNRAANEAQRKELLDHVGLKTRPERTLSAIVPAAKRPAGRRRSGQPSGRFLSSGLSEKERYLVAFAQAASEQNITGLSGDRKFEPLHIPGLEIPEFHLPDFEITSFEIEELQAPTQGNEEEL